MKTGGSAPLLHTSLLDSAELRARPFFWLWRFTSLRSFPRAALDL